MLILTWNNLRHPSNRHVICVLRNRDRCGCGCKGQCTLMAIWRVICWALNMLAQGEFPVARHDGTALGSYYRGAVFDTKVLGPAAGTKLSDIGLHGVTCQFRVDIAEMTKSLGFKGVSSNRPCFPSVIACTARCSSCRRACRHLPHGKIRSKRHTTTALPNPSSAW